MADQSQKNAPQTTGHAWDGDLQEYNNPLPTWWLWAFYASVVFAAIYWVLYPAWPIGDTFTKGISTVTFKNSEGQNVTTNWNARAEFLHDMESGPEALKQAAYMKQIQDASFEQIAASPEMTAFVDSQAKVLFADNCAACHGSGGVPAHIGQYPNLRDDSWLWGGTYQAIENTITNGHHGYMPPFAEVLNDKQVNQVANYVLSLSGHKVNTTAAAAGEKIFQGDTGGCYACHGNNGKGLQSLGSANLTDAIWTVADVPAAKKLKGQIAAISNVIRHGVSRTMPSWKDRLSPTQIKLLAVYVHNLGGGK